MKILLIHPNRFAQRYISVGISMISAVLKKSGHNVLFFDTSRYQDNDIIKGINDYSEKSIQSMQKNLQFQTVDLPQIEKSNENVFSAIHSTINTFKPDLIGFSITSSEFNFFLKIINEIKHYNISIVVGGSHATVEPNNVIYIDGVSMVVVGEGEEPIMEIAQMMESGKFRTDIKNVIFKINKKIIYNNVRPYIRNSLPFMDLDIFDKYHHIGAYQGKLVVYARYEAGRGCPYKCSYCINEILHQRIYANEKKHVRFKTPQRIIKELIYMKNKINFDIIRFVDETFTSYSLDWLKEFAALYKKNINKPMIITSRPENVTKAKMEIIREANSNIQITMGIESGNEKIRKEILNRKLSNQTIINAYDLCHKLNFPSYPS